MINSSMLNIFWAIIFPLTSFSQIVIKVNKENNGTLEPISFIKLSLGNDRFFTDGNGEIKTDFQSINCSDLLVEDMIYQIESCDKDHGIVAITVSEKINSLPEIDLKSVVEFEIENRKRSKLYSAVLLQINDELITKLEFNDIVDFYPRELNFRVNKTRGIDFRSNSINGILKINLYRESNGKLYKEFQSQGIHFEYDKSEDIDFKFPSYVSDFHNKMYIGIEYVGSVIKDGTFTEESYYLRLGVSNRQYDNYQFSSYLANTSSRDLNDLVKMKKIEESMRIPEKNRGRSLNIGITLMVE